MPRKGKKKGSRGEAGDDDDDDAFLAEAIALAEGEAEELARKTSAEEDCEAILDSDVFMPKAGDAAQVEADRRAKLKRLCQQKRGAKAVAAGRLRLRDSGGGGGSSKQVTPDGEEMDIDAMQAELGGKGGGHTAALMNMLNSMKRFGIQNTLDMHGVTWEKFRTLANMDKKQKKQMRKMTGMDMSSAIAEAAEERREKKARKAARRRKKRAKERAEKKRAAEAAAEGEEEEEEEVPELPPEEEQATMDNDPLLAALLDP